MYIRLIPHLQNLVKYKKPPKVHKIVHRHFDIGLVKTPYQNMDALYKTFYNRVNTNYSTWNISMFQTGFGVVKGQLQENNKPISDCVLHLIQSCTGVKAATTYSDTDGNFKFTGIATDIQYFVIAVHKKRLFNAVVLDDVRLDSRVNYDQSEV